jgi:hypothetical protein
MVAALDRQHPRDLFDVSLLLESSGISDELKTAFIVYLISHNRPIAELLNPSFRDISRDFENDFLGMTALHVSLQDLKAARQRLLDEIFEVLSDDDRQFLLDFKKGNPSREHLGLSHIPDLPAVRWKQMNLVKLSPEKRENAVQKLAKILFSDRTM